MPFRRERARGAQPLAPRVAARRRARRRRCSCSVGIGEAQAGARHARRSSRRSWKWTPLLATGFAFNIAISFLAMAIGTVARRAARASRRSRCCRPVRGRRGSTTQFFRNAPWLVLLFYCMFLLPFEVTYSAPRSFRCPDWLKATLGLRCRSWRTCRRSCAARCSRSRPANGNPPSRSRSSRRQTLWMIILPQCVKRMLPPWMNLYAILDGRRRRSRRSSASTR